MNEGLIKTYQKAKETNILTHMAPTTCSRELPHAMLYTT